MSTPLTNLYDKKATEAENELGRDFTKLACRLATKIYSRRGFSIRELHNVPEEKRDRVLYYANELADILRSAEPLSLQKL